jgi:hypothetical protein
MLILQHDKSMHIHKPTNLLLVCCTLSGCLSVVSGRHLQTSAGQHVIIIIIMLPNQAIASTGHSICICICICRAS